jgi:hypothetical protein
LSSKATGNKEKNMPNPFKGGWGFDKKPPEEPDIRFDVEDIGSMTKVKIKHTKSRPPGTKSDGDTTANEISFARKIPGTTNTILYWGRSNPPPPLPGFDGRIEGTYRVVPDTEIAKHSKAKRKPALTDDDWTANRPA